jgi:hypothetical protein
MISRNTLLENFIFKQVLNICLNLFNLFKILMALKQFKINISQFFLNFVLFSFEVL